MYRHIVRVLPLLALLTADAGALAPDMNDIEEVEHFLGDVAEDASLQVCLEPFYPPGQCRPARFTEGLRYNWVHSTDAVSNENLSLIHDAERSGGSAVFRSTIPGYGAMRLNRFDQNAWCMPEHTINGNTAFHLRIGGFSERERRRSEHQHRLSSYGLYLVAETEDACQQLAHMGRQIMD